MKARACNSFKLHPFQLIPSPALLPAFTASKAPSDTASLHKRTALLITKGLHAASFSAPAHAAFT